MTRNLRVLIVEDSPDDAELTRRELRRAGYDISSDVVATEAEYARSLAASDWDVILCDHNLPAFDSTRALKLLQDRQEDIPFIIVSGAIGEETAVAAMKAGASDYVMKGNLARLAPAVERELREAAVRRERFRAEEALRLSEARLARVIESAMDAIVNVDADGRIVLFNPAAEKMFGYSAAEIAGEPIDLLLAKRPGGQPPLYTNAAHGPEAVDDAGDLVRLVARRRNGQEFPIEATISRVDLPGARFSTAILRDITDRVRAQEQVAASLREKEALLREIAEAEELILEVSTPVLPLDERLLLVPLIGMMDTRRMDRLTAVLLQAVRSTRAQVVVIDVTGLGQADGLLAGRLVQTVRVVAAMGAHTVISGIPTALAREMVGLGQLTEAHTVGDLRSAVETAERLLA